MSNRLMWKLLRKHVSALQLAGFALANMVGLTIVIVAVQFYADVRPLFTSDDGLIGHDFLVISKKVDVVGSLTGVSTDFTDKEIEEIESQSFCSKVGRFTGADYSVSASLGMGGGHSMHSQIFFESVPSEFLDVDTRNWTFTPQSGEVPVIISKDYLSLYNFGFASAAGMPKISEGMVGMIPLTFAIEGRGTTTLRGRIVGFSSRINTILVPEEFMRWSNAEYGRTVGAPASTSRLVVEVSSPGDVRVSDFMEQHGYEIAGDKGASSKAQYFLTLIIGIVVVVGLIISVLAFFVLMLSIFLILQKNSRKLQDLLMLGYSPSQVGAPYVKMVLIVDSVVLVLSVAAMLAGRAAYLQTLSVMGVEGESVIPAVATAVAVMAVIAAGNIVAIGRQIKRLWRD